LTFDSVTRVIESDLPVSTMISDTKVKRVKIPLRGNTVIRFSENVLYPMQLYEKYRDEEAGTKAVERFAANEQFIWF